MGREAMIELKCMCVQKNINDILDLLCNGGWTIYNEKGNIEYLPIGDDNFCWEEDDFSYEELKKIIEIKQQKNELVGIHLFYGGTDHGITLLLRDTQEMTISIGINRITIGEERDAFTDFSWYFSKLILILNKDESLLISYTFQDFID